MYDLDASSFNDKGQVFKGEPSLVNLNDKGTAPVTSPPGPQSAVRRLWEAFRDLCYAVQDSKTFQHITTAMIVSNAVILAIVW